LPAAAPARPPSASQALALATGTTITDEHVFQRARVLLICFEDGRDELRRRVYAAMKHYGFGNGDVAGYLFLAVPGPDTGKFLVLDQKGRPIPGGLDIAVADAVRRRQIDLVIVDPFVKTHRVPENDNGAMDAVVEMLARLAVELDIAVDIPHHATKGLTDPGNADRGRGASSVKDGGRLVFTLA
jgi:RecA-family ATPase